MLERVRCLIEHIGMIMAEGKLDSDNAHKLMFEVANLNGEIEKGLASAYATECWLVNDRRRERAQEKKP